MAELKIPKCPNCGTDKNVTISLVRHGETMDSSWYCTACQKRFTPEEDIKDKTLDAGVPGLNNMEAPAESRNLSALANEKMFRRTWIPMVYKANVSARTDNAVKEKRKELDSFISGKSLSANLNGVSGSTNFLRWLGLFLIIVLFLLTVVVTVSLLINGTSSYMDYNLYMKQMEPCMLVLTVVSAVVCGVALFMWNKNIKSQEAGKLEINSEIERVNGEIEKIEDGCKAEVRKELDSELVKNGFTPTADDELEPWWRDKHKGEGEKTGGNTRTKGSKRDLFIGYAISFGLILVLAIICMIVVFKIFCT